MNNKIATVIIAVLFISISASRGDKIIADGVISTSLVRILAHPEEYSGKRIQLIGYFKNEFEGRALYLSQDDAGHQNYENGIWIGQPNPSPKVVENVKSRFVRVIGTFYFNSKTGAGHLGLWPGELRDITFLARVSRS